MMRSIVFGLLVLLAADASGEAGRVCRIGAILPLSGRAQSIGESIKSGIELRLSELPPDVRSKIEIVYEDDGSESKNAVSAFQKISLRGLDVLFSAMSNSGNALAPLAEKNAVPMLSMAFDPQISQNRRYVVNVWTGVEDAAKAAVDEALRRAYRRLAYVTTSHEGNIAMRAAFEKFAGRRIEVAASEEILPGENDFRTIILKLQQLDRLDGVASFLHPSQAGLFAKQCRELGFSVPQFSLGNFEDRFVIKASEGGLLGQWYIGVDYDDRFLELLRSRYPRVSEFGSSYGYDSVTLIAAALGNNVPLPKLNEYLRTPAPFTGAARSFIFNGEGGYAFALAVKEVTADGFKKLRSVEPLK